MKALVVIDVQNDFIPGGQLEIQQGDLIVPVINRLQKYFDLVVATQDWHPQNHKSFASNHSNKKPFDEINLYGIKQILWPDDVRKGKTCEYMSSELPSSTIIASQSSSVCKTREFNALFKSCDLLYVVIIIEKKG